MKGLEHGQIWWADLDKVRPVLILTRGTIASRLTRIIIAPITTIIRGIPTEVGLGPAEGVAEGSVANFDNLQLIQVSALLKPAGRVAAERWPECCQATAHMMACS